MDTSKKNMCCCIQGLKDFVMSTGDHWLSSFSLPPNVGEIDSQFMEKNQKLFSSLERSGKNR